MLTLIRGSFYSKINNLLIGKSYIKENMLIRGCRYKNKEGAEMWKGKSYDNERSSLTVVSCSLINLHYHNIIVETQINTYPILPIFRDGLLSEVDLRIFSKSPWTQLLPLKWSRFCSV